MDKMAVTITENSINPSTLSGKYDRILSLCETGKKSGVYTQIRCPCNRNHKHADKAKSASLGLHANGISFKCFAGCQTDDFLKALKLTYRDLYPDNERLPERISTYYKLDRTVDHEKVKFRNADGSKDFKQRTFDDKGNIIWKATGGIPYAYQFLPDAIKADRTILYGEGEKDVDTMRLLGYEATTMGGASDWKA